MSGWTGRAAATIAAWLAMALLPSMPVLAETVGDDLIARFAYSRGGGNPPTGLDVNTGMKLIVPEAFTEAGTLTQWGFYSGSFSQFTPLTPLIFHREPGTSKFTIVGVGTNQQNTGATVGKAILFDFDLILGSADVGPDYYFGVHQGASGVILPGTGTLFNSSNTFNFVDYDPAVVNATPYLYHTVASGSNPAPNLGLELVFTPFPDNRVYSLSAISVPVPEPSTIALAGIGLLLVAARYRARGQALGLRGSKPVITP